MKFGDGKEWEQFLKDEEVMRMEEDGKIPHPLEDEVIDGEQEVDSEEEAEETATEEVVDKEEEKEE